ncbi:MAG: serpin family protein [Acutalibacteraceae bacterium]|nr:serpin family protein [Acutalibacteraceae bacterium]
MKRFLICSVAVLLIISLVGCGMTASANDLMSGITANKVKKISLDDDFLNREFSFSTKLFDEIYKVSDSKNVVISPLSVQLALAMTANGAGGATLKEMEDLLGDGMDIDLLSKYLNSYTSSLSSSKKAKLSIANSIWFNDNDEFPPVKKSFLQKNADYFGAGLYKIPFNDEALNDINAWVSKNTDGMIDKMIDEISPSTLMFLINAICFDAEWETKYEPEDISDGKFTSLYGKIQDVEFMSSQESLYLDDGSATGFIKNYAGGKYSFAALLPNENVDLSKYIGTLKDTLKDTIKNAENSSVSAYIPKFTFDYGIRLNEVLAALGMEKAFSVQADFSGICNGDIFISRVLHKAKIILDADGTKAAAATSVEIKCMGTIQEEKTVYLNRPFVYMIIDNETQLPIFMGTVTEF